MRFCLLLMLFAVCAILPVNSIGQSAPIQKDWRSYVAQCLDTLIEHGTDRYGPKKTPMLMAILDVESRRSPEKPELLDSLVRLEDRLHRRGERGSNLWYDQSTLRAMYRVSELTGQERYAAAANDYINYALRHCYKPTDDRPYANGMFVWGSHIYWDCYKERPAGDQDGIAPHEILVYQALWSKLYEQNPQATQAIVDGIWRWHVVDKNTGQHNRHDDARPGCDFAFAGGVFTEAFAAMYAATGEQRYLDRARSVAGWHWNQRNRRTGLVADAPSLKNRYDGNHCFTTVVGPHSASLLRCFELTRDPYFKDIAIQYIQAYDRYAWDEKAQNYYAMIKLDGTPVSDQPKGSGYDAWAPSGYVNVWRTSIFSYEFTLAAAQSAVYAYELSGPANQRDPELLKIARRWAGVVERDLPPKTGRRWKSELEKAMPAVLTSGGAYAEDYGRAISFFVHMFRATGEEPYLNTAHKIARDAVEKLFVDGLFKGHPAKPYYEATNGVGLLLWSLLELDAPDEKLRGAF